MNGGGSNGYGGSSERYGYGAPVNPRHRDLNLGTSARGAGGYGGLGPLQTQQSQPPPQASYQSPTQSRPQSSRVFSPTTARSTYRPTDLERRRANRKSVDGRSKSRTRDGAGTQQMQEILKGIKKEWDFMTQDNCIPVQVASQLLDESSLGLAHRYSEFRETQERLQNALRTIVNEHHQGFNSSIGTYHQIQASIQASHARVRALKDDLLQAKQNLSTAKPEYTSLVNSSQSYARMLDELSVIEQIQQAPERLEASISEKRFLVSVDILQDASKLSRRPQLQDISALSETKTYISNQQHSLVDILIEELHNHLYLKSPYCEDRWQRYTPTEASKNQDQAFAEGMVLDQFLSKLQEDIKSPLTEDTSRNPEADSFHYIYVIAESLSKLGRLEEAVDGIEERLPVELFKVVERSNNEVLQRHPTATRNGLKSKQNSVGGLLGEQPDKAVLSDLLETLYAKFEAIAESHRVFHDAIIGISRRQDGYSSQRISRGFKGLWQLYQSEMRSLLHDYLSTGEGGHRGNQSIQAETNVFRYQRNRNQKSTFKLDSIDNSTTADVKPVREELVTTWQKFVPGLASLSQTGENSSVNVANNNSNNIENTAAGHKLLVEPSVFNIGSLLPPSVHFLNRLKKIVPPNADIVVSTLSSFLNDFLINVFHPQLEETLEDFCAQTFSELDIFQQDPLWQQYSARAIYRGAVKFYNMVEAFCRMLDDLTHDQVFSQLLITQLNGYYDRCNNWYKSLVTRVQTESSDGTRRLKAAAAFAEIPHIVSLTDRLWQTREDGSALLIIRNETDALLEKARERPLNEADLVSDRKSQEQLCLLYTSMRWLSLKLAGLRKISDRATNSSSRRDSTAQSEKHQRRLTHSLPERPAEASDAAYLPLSSETAALFDGIVDAYQELASAALRTLHLEVRCQVLQKLGQLFRGSYIYHEQVETAEENALALVDELLTSQNIIRSLLQDREYTYVSRGITHLVDTIVVTSLTSEITALNDLGVSYLSLNARVLYHNLINIEPQGDLPQTFAFISCFEAGPEAVIRAAKMGKSSLTRDELESCLQLWFSAQGNDMDGEAEKEKRKKEMEDWKKRLDSAFRGRS